MTDLSEAYVKALLALSGGSQLVEARKALLTSTDDDQVKSVGEHCVRKLLSRQELEKALCSLLDQVVAGQGQREGTSSSSPDR